MYKEIKVKTKVVIHEAKLKGIKVVFDKLESKGGKDVYRLAKSREAKTSDKGVVKNIKDTDKNYLGLDKNIKD